VQLTLVIDESQLRLLKMSGFLLMVTSAYFEHPILLSVRTPDSYSGESVDEMMDTVLQENDISPNQITAVCSDNAQYMIKAVRLFQRGRQYKHDVHSRCISHGGNLMIETTLDSIKPVKNLLVLLRQLASAAPGRLHKGLQEKGMLLSKFRYAKTRWNTAIPSLRHAFDKKEQLLQGLSDTDDICCGPLTEKLADDSILAGMKLVLRCAERIDQFIKCAQTDQVDYPKSSRCGSS
jgi:hypothetical protein